MSRTVTMHVGCAFCGTVAAHHVSDAAPKRDQIVGRFKCASCDSTFQVQVKTMRTVKGKRQKEWEKAKLAEHERIAAQYVTDNERIAAELLTQPGCICGTEKAKQTVQVYGLREDGLSRGGTGVRDGHHGMPLPPRHRSSCPLNG